MRGDEGQHGVQDGHYERGSRVLRIYGGIVSGDCEPANAFGLRGGPDAFDQ